MEASEMGEQNPSMLDDSAIRPIFNVYEAPSDHAGPTVLGDDMAKRYSDIREKLAYVEVRLRSLASEIQRAALSDSSVDFLGQKVGEILSGCRECFDYCAKDLSEAFLPKQPRNIYFPFSKESLDKSFSGLSESNPELFNYLRDLTDKIERNNAIDQTIFGYRVIRDTNNLVNDKKHDRITLSQRKGSAATHVSFGEETGAIFSAVYPSDGEVPDFGADVHAQPMIGNHDDIQIKYVPEFRLQENNWEIGRYCRHALEVSWRVLDEIYHRFFEVRPGELDPHETLKSPEQRRLELALRSASPIITRLMVVALFADEQAVKVVRIGFDGVAETDDEDEIYLADRFIGAFNVYGWHRIKGEIDKAIAENVVRYEEEGTLEKPRYCEIELTPSNECELSLPKTGPMRFNRVVFGLGTKFRASVEQFAPTNATNEEAWDLAAQVFSLEPPRVAIGTRPIGPN